MEEKIFYDSDNHVKLCGILNKANNNKIVILCHGIRGDKEECGSFTYLAERLQKNDIVLLDLILMDMERAVEKIMK